MIGPNKAQGGAVKRTLSTILLDRDLAARYARHYRAGTRQHRKWAKELDRLEAELAAFRLPGR